VYRNTPGLAEVEIERDTIKTAGDKPLLNFVDK
jgi:hypothetical protein